VRCGLVGVLLIGAACGRGPDQAGTSQIDTGQTFLDAAGREHPIAAASRIVSLVPSATSTLHALGADRLLVGRTDYDTEPWAAMVPSVGGGLDPNLESLLALQPDLVIRFEGQQDRRTPARLDDFGIAHVAVRPEGLADIFTTIQIVGQVTGRIAGADSLAEVLRNELDEVAASVADRARPRVMYTLGGSPPWVSGPGTFVVDLITLAGGDNVFDDLATPWAAVSPEEVRTRSVEVVLVPDPATFDAGLVPGARIIAVGAMLDLPGPDVASAARRVAELIHRTGR
jgi:iron complex transport system substrate-binding protein